MTPLLPRTRDQLIDPDFMDLDVFVERSTGFLGKAIRWALGSDYNHVGLIFRLNYDRRVKLKRYGQKIPASWGANQRDEIGIACVIEAQSTVRVSALKERLAEDSDIAIGRCLCLDSHKVPSSITAALAFAGQGYGVKRLFAYGVEILTRRIPCLRAKLTKRMALDEIVCSYLAAHALAVAGESFYRNMGNGQWEKIDPRDCTPEDIADTFGWSNEWVVLLSEGGA